MNHNKFIGTVSTASSDQKDLSKRQLNQCYFSIPPTNVHLFLQFHSVSS